MTDEEEDLAQRLRRLLEEHPWVVYEVAMENWHTYAPETQAFLSSVLDIQFGLKKERKSTSVSGSEQSEDR